VCQLFFCLNLQEARQAQDKNETNEKKKEFCVELKHMPKKRLNLGQNEEKTET
jgi:hypothetical protein